MVKGPVPITSKAQIKAYNSDIIRFLEEQYILENGHRLALEEWQKDMILRPLFYDLDDDGLRKYSLALLGMPKKNGKSTLAAGIGLWFMFADEPYGEVIIAANNLDQASLVIFNKIKGAFRRNPQLKAAAKIYKDAIEMKETGTVCRPIAHKYETAAGVNPTLVLFDELWGFPSREFYDELTTSPARKNPLTVIVTYAGYDTQSLLYEIYKKGLEGSDPEMFFVWLQQNLASWVSEKYLAAQKRRMPANVYARFHENKWSAASGTFVTQEDIDKLHSVPWLVQFAPNPDVPFNYVAATDLGLSHDRTARAVGHFDHRDGRVYVDNLRLWEGTRDRHVQISDVEEDLVECAHSFRTTKLVVDPWQLEYVIQRLQKYYVIEPFNFQSDMRFMSQLLITMLRNGRLISYSEPLLDDEFKRLIAKQTASGWRIEHLRNQRNDIVVAVGMMAMEAVKEAIVGFTPPKEDEFESRPEAFASIRSKQF